ncbi:MAG: hypothetical protein E6J48_09835 [Chloroflexi bacterium]|nr:MAG: hypothetical protein E6J48_09835 [Chloroflexota bacterium]
MIMSILDTALFATPVPATLGVGFHNVGSGVLRASNEALVKQVERHYGERCGHLPLDAGNVRVLVVQHTTDIRTQMDYLSRLFGKAITPRMLDELRAENEKLAGPAPLVVRPMRSKTKRIFINLLMSLTWRDFVHPIMLSRRSMMSAMQRKIFSPGWRSYTTRQA